MVRNTAVAVYRRVRDSLLWKLWIMQDSHSTQCSDRATAYSIDEKGYHHTNTVNMLLDPDSTIRP